MSTENIGSLIKKLQTLDSEKEIEYIIVGSDRSLISVSVSQTTGDMTETLKMFDWFQK